MSLFGLGVRGLIVGSLLGLTACTSAKLSGPDDATLAQAKKVRIGSVEFMPEFPGLSQRGQMIRALSAGLMSRYGFVKYENIAALKEVGSDNNYLVCARFKKLISEDESPKHIAMLYQSGLLVNKATKLVDEAEQPGKVMSEYCFWFDKPEYTSFKFYNG